MMNRLTPEAVLDVFLNKGFFSSDRKELSCWRGARWLAIGLNSNQAAVANLLDWLKVHGIVRFDAANRDIVVLIIHRFQRLRENRECPGCGVGFEDSIPRSWIRAPACIVWEEEEKQVISKMLKEVPATAVPNPIPDPTDVGDQEVPMPVHAVQHSATVQVTDPEADEPEVTIVYDDDDGSGVADGSDDMEDEADGSPSLPPDPPSIQQVAEGPAGKRDPVREAVEELVAYLQVDEQDLRLEEGFSGLATRRAARRLRLEPFFAPLLSGNADEALVYGQKFRDEMMADLREVDRALAAQVAAARPATPVAPTVAARLRAAADRLLNEQVADLLNRVRRFLLAFRAARARYAEAYAVLNLYTVECLPRIRALIPSLDLAEFQLQNLHSPAARLSMETTLQALTDMQAEWTRLYGAYEPLDEDLHRVQGEFGPLVEAAGILSRRITSFTDTCVLLEETMPPSLEQELEEAIAHLQLAQAKREAYGSATRYLIPKDFSELQERIQLSRRILERLDGEQALPAAPPVPPPGATSPAVLFRSIRPREEELEALVLLAAAHHVPGTGKRPRKGKSIVFYVKLLVSAGVITPGEAQIAKERIFKLRKALFSYMRDGRTHRYTPNALALQQVERYRSELVDVDAFHVQIDQAWIRYREEFAQMRSAPKAGE